MPSTATRIVITADTYTSVLPLAQRKCADATAKLVLTADRRTREKIRSNGRRKPAQAATRKRCARVGATVEHQEAAGRATDDQ